jgi:hypothetical protein
MVKRVAKKEVLDDATLQLDDAELKIEAKTKVTIATLKEFMQNSVGTDCDKEFRKLLRKAAGTERQVNSLIDEAYRLTEERSDAIPWLKTCVRAITNELMEPRKRFADAMFFPSAASEARVIEYLGQAEKSMEVCLFTITNNQIADALRAAHHRGVAVRIITDDENLKMLGSDVRDLGEYGIPFKADSDPRSHMHNKFVVIDDLLLLTGSFNWTKQAVFKNQENLALFDDAGLVSLYKQEFEKLWAQFVTPPPLPPLTPLSSLPPAPAELQVDEAIS